MDSFCNCNILNIKLILGGMGIYFRIEFLFHSYSPNEFYQPTLLHIHTAKIRVHTSALLCV